ncbi:MAG: hypothetical protein AAGJ81_01495 [Verrucomicrobiota bacterium]
MKNITVIIGLLILVSSTWADVPKRGSLVDEDGEKHWFTLKMEASSYFTDDDNFTANTLFLQLEEPLADTEINRAILADAAIRYLGFTNRSGFGTRPDQWKQKGKFQEKGILIRNSETPQVVWFIPVGKGEFLSGANAAVGIPGS